MYEMLLLNELRVIGTIREDNTIHLVDRQNLTQVNIWKADFEGKIQEGREMELVLWPRRPLKHFGTTDYESILSELLHRPFSLDGFTMKLND